MEITTFENGIFQGIIEISKDVSAYTYGCKSGTVQIAFCNDNLIKKNLAMNMIQDKIDELKKVIDFL
jgi:hypothetical protein